MWLCNTRNSGRQVAMLKAVDTESGFFRAAHERLVKTLSEDQLEGFTRLDTDQARFQWLWNLPAAGGITVNASTGGKDRQQALLFKGEGNKSFQKGDNRTAVRHYASSVLHMPVEPPEDLAVVYANRSAAFYHLEEYLMALDDIDIALSLGYPKDLSYKVYDRRARCLLALNQFKDARPALQATIASLDDARLSLERRKKWQMDLQIMLGMLDKGKALINAPLSRPGVLEAPPPGALLGGPNAAKGRGRASSALRFEDSVEQGRFVRASSEIRAGDLLVTERPSIAVLLQERANTHCFQCFKRVRAPVACPQCSVVMFCSRSCRDAAQDSHHLVECRVLPALWSSGASITCLMALRALSQIPKGAAPYDAVMSLVTHTERRKSEDLLHRTHMAVFLARCLQAAGHVGEGEALVQAGGQLLKLLQLLQFNAHEVSEMQLEAPCRYDTARSVFLGGALYSTLALFNHSCDPGIVRYFCGTSVVVRAVKRIRVGQPVCENYGPIYSATPREERRDALLKQYWFNCMCEACVEDWPLYRNMDSGGIMRFRCDAGGSTPCDNVLAIPTDTLQFMARCNLCHEHTNILKGLKALQDMDSMLRVAHSAMAEGNISEALDRFLAILSLLDETLAPPFKDYVLCQQNVRTCMVAHGNIVVLSAN